MRLLVGLILFLCISIAPISAQVDIVPWQFSPSSYQFLGPNLPQGDTLQIPFFEDFSGDYSMICDIREVMIGSDEGYEIQFCHLHGLKDGDSVRISNSKGNPILGFNTDIFEGIRYVKVLDLYTIQIFTNAALSIVVPTQTIPVNMCSVRKLPYQGPVSYADTLKFVFNNGGALINNTMANFPVSVGVASLDGLNQNGIPYSNLPTTNGYGDNLTSLPINIKNYSPSDSLYFSFYWQSVSFGETPENTDSLILEFKDTTGLWSRVYKVNGNTALVDSFYFVGVCIKDSIYFGKHFQFRFRNYGRLSGRFDVWNVDHIYLDTGRTFTSLIPRDAAIIQFTRSFLKTGTAIPYHHFAGVSASQQDALVQKDYQLSVRNLQTAIPRKNELIIRTNLNLGIDTLSSIAGDEDAPRYTVTMNSNKLLADTLLSKVPTSTPYVVKLDYRLGNGDGFLVSPIGRQDFTKNNFAASETYFYDYYAYDDGTAEMSFRSNQNGIRLGNEFNFLVTDTLTHIDIAFNRNNGADLSGTSIFLNIWNSSNNLIYSEQVSIQYSNDINGFTRYKLSNIVRLTPGIYTIGYEQRNNESLFIGYDRNNDYSSKIKINATGSWYYYSPPGGLTGALMIRPVFSKNQFIVTKTIDEEKNKFIIYPNPTGAPGRLSIYGNPTEVLIYSVEGREVLRISTTENADYIDLPYLPKGLYLVFLKKGEILETKKLLIE
ncbi:MAG: T9SS type A sorting domain-containing protein [Cytophagaceae bacterium]